MKALIALMFGLVLGYGGVAHADGKIKIEVGQDEIEIELTDAQTDSLQVLLEDDINFPSNRFPHVPAWLEDELRELILEKTSQIVKDRSFVKRGEIFEAVRKACANNDLTTKEKNAISVNLIGRAC